MKGQLLENCWVFSLQGSDSTPEVLPSCNLTVDLLKHQGLQPVVIAAFGAWGLSLPSPVNLSDRWTIEGQELAARHKCF